MMVNNSTNISKTNI